MAIAAKRAVSGPQTQAADQAKVSRAPSRDLPGEAHPSPARALQMDIEQRLSDATPRWSRRRTAVVALGLSGVLWIGVIAVVTGVISAI